MVIPQFSQSIEYNIPQNNLQKSKKKKRQTQNNNYYILATKKKSVQKMH
jgi:hypothetical protein